MYWGKETIDAKRLERQKFVEDSETLLKLCSAIENAEGMLLGNIEARQLDIRGQDFVRRYLDGSDFSGT